MRWDLFPFCSNPRLGWENKFCHYCNTVQRMRCNSIFFFILCRFVFVLCFQNITDMTVSPHMALLFKLVLRQIGAAEWIESNRIESSYITVVYLGNKSEFCSGAVEQRRKCLKIPVDSIKPFEDCISFPCGFVRFRVSHELGIFYNNEANAFTQWRTGQTRLWIVARCEEREVSISQGVEDFFLERQFRNWTAPKCLNTAYTTCT